MDYAVLSAASALLGSLVGGASTFSASWLVTRQQYRTQTPAQKMARREALYSEFIVEASRRLAEAWAEQAQSADVLAGLNSAVERMRLQPLMARIRILRGCPSERLQMPRLSTTQTSEGEHG